MINKHSTGMNESSLNDVQIFEVKEKLTSDNTGNSKKVDVKGRTELRIISFQTQWTTQTSRVTNNVMQANQTTVCKRALLFFIYKIAECYLQTPYDNISRLHSVRVKFC